MKMTEQENRKLVASRHVGVREKCRLAGISVSTVHRRMKRHGIGFDEALAMPKMTKAESWQRALDARAKNKSSGAS